MRPDVKLGVVISLVVVFVAGGYYMYRDSRQTPIPMSNRSTSLDSRSGQAKHRPSVAKQGPLALQRPSPNGRSTSRREDGLSKRKDNIAKNSTASSKPSSRKRLAQQPQMKPTAGKSAAPADSSRAGKIASTRESAGKVSALRGTQRKTEAAPKKPDSQLRLADKHTAIESVFSTSSAIVNNTRVATDTHRVQPGDTFASLAQAYYGHEKYTQFLMNSNPDPGVPERLKIGKIILIPPLPAGITRSITRTHPVKPDSTSRPSSRPRVYTVRGGDSFYRIAHKVLGDASRWEELFNLNKALVNGDPRRLQVGQVIVLPAG